MNLDTGTRLVIFRCLMAQALAHRVGGADKEDFANHCERLAPLFSGRASMATLSDDEGKIILAAIKAQAMAFGEMARRLMQGPAADGEKAIKLAYFAGECDRVAQMLETRN